MKILRNITNEIIIDFLYNEIFINYKSFKKLFFDNKTNFLNRIIILYLIRFKTRYRITISYYFRINDKMKNLNKSLNKMFIKYFIKKPTHL